METKPLGKRQASFLDAIKRYGRYPGGGFVYGSRSESLKIAESLVKRGLLRRMPIEPKGRTMDVLPYRYVLADRKDL